MSIENILIARKEIVEPLVKISPSMSKNPPNYDFSDIEEPVNLDNLAVVSCIANFPDAREGHAQIHRLLQDETEIFFRPLQDSPTFRVVNANLVFNPIVQKNAVELILEVPQKNLKIFFPKADHSVFNSPALSNL